MRVLDVGCGTGITTAALAEVVGPSGHATGVDFSEDRLQEAQERYGSNTVDFVCHDIRQPYKAPLPYDFVWVRFLLEYFREEQQEIAANCLASLKIGGIACLADSDNNSMAHYGPYYTDRVQTTVQDIMSRVTQQFNFDPYAGRRLYGHLYALEFANINCMIEPHHLVYGQIPENDAYNWMRKVEINAEKSGCQFEAYAGEEFSHYPTRYDAFMDEYRAHIQHHARFIYTPIVICRGERTLRVMP